MHAGERLTQKIKKAFWDHSKENFSAFFRFFDISKSAGSAIGILVFH